MRAPIFTIRVLGAIWILLRLFAHNFMFGAEANISARAEVRHVMYQSIPKPPIPPPGNPRAFDSR